MTLHQAVYAVLWLIASVFKIAALRFLVISPIVFLDREIGDDDWQPYHPYEDDAHGI